MGSNEGRKRPESSSPEKLKARNKEKFTQGSQPTEGEKHKEEEEEDNYEDEFEKLLDKDDEEEKHSASDDENKHSIVKMND